MLRICAILVACCATVYTGILLVISTQDWKGPRGTSYVLAASRVAPFSPCPGVEKALLLYRTDARMTTPLEKPQIIAHIQKSLNYTIFDCKWIPCSAKFVCMGNFPRGTGVMQIYEVQRGDAVLIKEVTRATLAFCLGFFASFYIHLSLICFRVGLFTLLLLERSVRVVISMATTYTLLNKHYQRLNLILDTPKTVFVSLTFFAS